MKDLGASSLLPFVPSGKDYEASRRLFADLEFEEVWENDGYAGFRNGDADFILQRFDDDHFASNFMVRLNVDVDRSRRCLLAYRPMQVTPCEPQRERGPLGSSITGR